MFNVLSSLNWLAVLLATVATFLLGGAWFMGLFKAPYAASLGRTDLGDRKPSPIFIAGPLVCGAIVNLTDAILLKALNVTTYGDGLAFALITGVGYLVAQTLNISINPNFPRPFFYTAISGGNFLVGNLLACTILVALS